MKLFIFLAAVCVLHAQQPLRSPEIASDRKVTFRLHAPEAKEVALTGEFMKGAKPLVKAGDGTWSVTVGPIEPEIYYYNFVIDGVRTIDPGNPGVKSGSTPSTIQSILDIPGPAPRFFDPYPVLHGEVHTHWYASKSLGTTRRLTVYTPPGYDRSNNRYPVLYLFHGANADEVAWTRLGRANLIMDNLYAANKAKLMIIVMPFGYGVTPGSQGNTPAFSRDLLEDVVPFIESHYRTYNDREHRAIAGLSMGGGESLTIGLHHLELFSYVGGFSAGLRTPDLQPSFGDFLADAKTANEKLKLLWIGCGTDDGLFPTSETFSKMLDDAQIKHVFHKSDGAHTWMVWRRYLREFAPLLF